VNRRRVWLPLFTVRGWKFTSYSRFTVHDSRINHLSNLFGRAGEDGAVAADDDGTLDQFGVRGHQADDLVVGVFTAAEAESLVCGLARAEQFARGEARLADDLAQRRLVEAFGVEVDPLELYAALTEQPVGLAALRSSRLLVDDDLVGHENLSDSIQ
jgi:hypothetical protein